jgi:hypothetical protein
MDRADEENDATSTALRVKSEGELFTRLTKSFEASFNRCFVNVYRWYSDSDLQSVKNTR